MGVDADRVEETLAEVVSKTLRHDAGPAAIFERHMVRMRRWVRGGRSDVPPFLALLATFCIAAEQMAAGDGMSSNNYYGRLRSVLGWDPTRLAARQGYQRVAERLWGELNRWLIELDGLRGLPTAYALSHRYVGLTVSQALIRSADHERLKEFFRQYGFAPGADVAPSDLVLVLGDWITGNPEPSFFGPPASVEAAVGSRSHRGGRGCQPGELGRQRPRTRRWRSNRQRRHAGAHPRDRGFPSQALRDLRTLLCQ